MHELPPPSPGDVRHPALMHLKGALFALIALLSASLVVLLTRDWRIAALVALTAWSSARAYYYAFYVIERYVDPSFRFAGLWSVMRFLCSRRRP